MAKKDLFDDSTMTFGEHLEVLRVHLWRAIIGLVICTVAAFFFSEHIIVAIQAPVIEALDNHFSKADTKTVDKGVWQSVKDMYTNHFVKTKAEREAEEAAAAEEAADPRLTLELK